MTHNLMCLVAVVCCAGTSLVSADDSIVADFGKTVFPQQTKKIKMVSERVDITFGVDKKNHRESKVNCHFVFRNETQDVVKVKVGFPGNKSEHGPAWRQPLRDFKAFVDGKPYLTEVKEERLGDDSTDPHYSYREWYLWEMSFPPKKDTLVDNSYSYSLGSDSGYSRLILNYELATGANWSGKIGEAVVVVKYEDAKDLEERVISIYPAGWARKGNQIVWHLKNIEPMPVDNILIMEKNLSSAVTQYAGPLLFRPKAQKTAAALGQDFVDETFEVQTGSFVARIKVEGKDYGDSPAKIVLRRRWVSDDYPPGNRTLDPVTIEAYPTEDGLCVQSGVYGENSGKIPAVVKFDMSKCSNSSK